MSALATFDISPTQPVRGFHLAVTFGEAQSNPRGAVVVARATDSVGEVVDRSDNGWFFSERFGLPAEYLGAGDIGQTVLLRMHQLEGFATQIELTVHSFADTQATISRVASVAFLGLQSPAPCSVVSSYLPTAIAS